MINCKTSLVQMEKLLQQALAGTGLLVRGDFFVFSGQKVGWLIGNNGKSFWQTFNQSEEYLAQQANPIDGYSERIVNSVAAKIAVQLALDNIVTTFPSAGPPYYPFQQWAVMAEGLKQSPLGILMHPTFGLWHAYRGAILVDVSVELFALAEAEVNARQAPAHPCDSCLEKPCLTNCPVNAFADGYAVSDCANYVMQQDNDCYRLGCVARLACPYASEYQYNSEHHCFHLHHFAKKRSTL